MVKITIENDRTKTEMSGKCLFAAVIDPEGDSDVVTALVGETSPGNLAEVLGKCIGAQITDLAPDFTDQLRLLDILAKSTARGMSDDVKVVKKEVGPERKENDE